MDFNEMVKQAAADYKEAQASQVKTAGIKLSEEHYTAFALGMIKFASDADLSLEEFTDFHGRALAYMSAQK